MRHQAAGITKLGSKTLAKNPEIITNHLLERVPRKGPPTTRMLDPQKGSPEGDYGNGSRKGLEMVPGKGSWKGNLERFPERRSRKGLIISLIDGTLSISIK